MHFVRAAPGFFTGGVNPRCWGQTIVNFENLKKNEAEQIQIIYFNSNIHFPDLFHDIISKYLVLIQS